MALPEKSPPQLLTNRRHSIADTEENSFVDSKRKRPDNKIFDEMTNETSIPNQYDDLQEIEKEKPNGVDHFKNERIISLLSRVLEAIWRKYGYSEHMISHSEWLQTRLLCSSLTKKLDQIKNGPYEILKRKLVIRLDNGSHKNMKLAFDQYWKTKAETSKCPAQPICFDIYDLPVKTTEEEIKRCRQFIEEILDKYGQNFREFTHSRQKDGFQFQNSTDWYLKFTDWIRRMPNLKKITILHEHKIKSSDVCEFVHEFPVLPKMEHLSDLHWPAPVFRAALMTNNHITSLSVRNETFTFENIALPDLKELTINTQNCKGALLQNYKTLPGLNAPLLEKLTIYGQLGLDDAPIFTQILTKFGENLQSLEFTIGTAPHEEINSVAIKTQIKTLKLKCGENFQEFWTADEILKFLQIFPQLETIILCGFKGCNCLQMCNYSKKRKVVRCIHLRKDFVSVLWVTFPKLKQVEITPIHFQKPLLFIREVKRNPELKYAFY